MPDHFVRSFVWPPKLAISSYANAIISSEALSGTEDLPTLGIAILG
jgi:hypothetical protein